MQRQVKVNSSVGLYMLNTRKSTVDKNWKYYMEIDWKSADWSFIMPYVIYYNKNAFIQKILVCICMRVL